MQDSLDEMTIGAFANVAGVNVETIRYYQRKGLIAEPPKPRGGIRRYGERDVARVRFVKSAQYAGFSLDEIAQLLRLEDGTHCREAAEIASHRLADIRSRIANLARMEAVLAKLLRRCRTPHPRISCPLIASLQDDTRRSGKL